MDMKGLQKMSKSIVQPIGYSVKDACAVTSLGRTKIYSLINERKLEIVRIGSRTIIKADSIHRLMEAA
jgi:excisionase family DNA binding protein